MVRKSIVAEDKAHVWHPYTAMDLYEQEDPIVVASAQGCHLVDVDGTRYIDGNSSWWVAALGHGHPRLLRVLREQSSTLAHCALAGITHEPVARFAKELCDVAPKGLTRVFFTDNGSTAVEAAVKMAVQMWNQTGRPEKKGFVALDGAFHGDTVGAASLGGVEVFRRPFAGVLFECARAPIPACDGPDGEAEAYAQAFGAMEALVEKNHRHLAAVVVEPLVQGAAGMRMYPARYLRDLAELCKRREVLLIVDEVFTGFGRTGPMWACESAGVVPDILCLGKALASLLPMGATLTTERVFDAFRGSKDRAFYYGHTFCGHPLGAALGREVLAIYREENILGEVARKARLVEEAFRAMAPWPGVERVRSMGMIGAADLRTSGTQGYLGQVGWRVYEEARRLGAYLRPLGSTVYVCPPLTMPDETLRELLAILHQSVRKVLESPATA